MARLNKKSTKAAIVKLLKENEMDRDERNVKYWAALGALNAVAKELELDIKPEEYQTK